MQRKERVQMPSTDFLVFSKMCSGDYKKEFFCRPDLPN